LLTGLIAIGDGLSVRGEEGDSMDGDIADPVIGTGEEDAPTMETGDGDERGELDRFPKFVGVGLLTFLMRPCRKFCSLDWHLLEQYMLLGLPNCPPKLLHSLFLHFLEKGFVRSIGGRRPFPLCSRRDGPVGPGTTVIRSFPSHNKVLHLLAIDSPSILSLKATPTEARKARGDDLSCTSNPSESASSRSVLSSI